MEKINGSGIKMVNDELVSEITRINNHTIGFNYKFTEQSVLAKEITILNNVNQVNNSIALISILYDATIQYFSGYALNIMNGFPLSAFSCIRSFLETAAICSWLSDPNIMALERLARQITYRINVSKYYVKPFRSEVDYESLLEDSKTYSEGLFNELQVASFKNDKYNMPQISTLIDDQLAQKPIYSYLSNIVHGHHSEIITSAGEVKSSINIQDMKRIPIERKVNPQFVNQIEICIKDSYIILIEKMWNLFGWDLKLIL
ncbi:hypothetical protein JR338_10585 [Chloroflexota bacterium]|nr:hypothetical protein JR338_10585 [Chloroflexota bacterium]